MTTPSQQQPYYLHDQVEANKQLLGPQLPMQQHQPDVRIQQPQIQPAVFLTAAQAKFEDFPVRLRCQHCSADVSTNVTFKPGTMTWLIVGGICFLGAPLGLFLGCCLIPLCIDSLKDAEHTCSNCNRVVGIYKRMS